MLTGMGMGTGITHTNVSGTDPIASASHDLDEQFKNLMSRIEKLKERYAELEKRINEALQS